MATQSPPTAVGMEGVDLSSFPPAARKKLLTGIQKLATEEYRRRTTSDAYRLATSALRDASPAELAEDYPLVRAAYDAYPSAWLDLARAHPAPYLEYAIRDDAPHSPTHGQRLHLGKMHLEMVQVLLRHRLAACISSAEHGATTIVMGMVEWSLGRNPDNRIKVLGEDDDSPKKRVLRLRNRIQSCPEIRHVFPAMRPTKADQWTMQRFYVARAMDSQEPSVEGRGILGAATGGRTDIAVYDDVVGKRNAITQPAKKPQVKTSFFSDWFGTGAQGRHWYVANYWASDDLTQHLRHLAEQATEDFTPQTQELPSGGKLIVGRDWVYLEHTVRRGTNISPWPERWSEEEIATVRRITPPPDMARRWECRRPTAGEEEIQPEWMRYAPAPPLDQFEAIIQFCDPASGEASSNDYTGEAIAGIRMVKGAEGQDSFPIVHFLHADHYRLRMTDRVKLFHRNMVRFKVTDPAIENKHDGKTMADMVEDVSGRRLRRPTPTQGKRERMVRWIPLFRMGRVFFTPDMHPDTVALLNDSEAPSIVSEILGTAEHDDIHDAAEGILEIASELFVFGEQEFPMAIHGVTDRPTEDAARKQEDPGLHPLLRKPQDLDDDAMGPDPFDDWTSETTTVLP